MNESDGRVERDQFIWWQTPPFLVVYFPRADWYAVLRGSDGAPPEVAGGPAAEEQAAVEHGPSRSRGPSSRRRTAYWHAVAPLLLVYPPPGRTPFLLWWSSLLGLRFPHDWRWMPRLFAGYGGVFVAGLLFTTCTIVLAAEGSRVNLYSEVLGNAVRAELGAAAAANYRTDAIDRPRAAVLKEDVVEEASRDTQIRRRADTEGAGGFGFTADTLSVLLRTDQRLSVEAPDIVMAPGASAAGRANLPPVSPGAPGSVVAPLPGTPAPVLVREPPAPAPGATPAAPVPSPGPPPLATPTPPPLVTVPGGAEPGAPGAPAGPAPEAPAQPDAPAPSPPQPAAPGAPPAGPPPAAPPPAAPEPAAPPAPAPSPAPSASPQPSPAPSPAPSPPASPAPSPSAQPSPPPSPQPSTPPAPTVNPTAAPSASATPPSRPPATATPAPAPPALVFLQADPGQPPGAIGASFVEVSAMTPGLETAVTKEVTVRNNGAMPFTYAMTTSGGAGLLWTGTDTVDDSLSDGLQLRLSRGGTIIYDGPLKVAAFEFGVVVPPSGADIVEYFIYLPVTAGNEFQGLTTSITFSWTATG